MGNEDVICIGTYPSETRAEIARAFLEAHQIRAYVSRDDCGGMRPHLQLMTGVRLMISAVDKETASALLKGTGSPS